MNEPQGRRALDDPRIEAVLDRLYAEAAGQLSFLERRREKGGNPRLADGTVDWTRQYTELRELYLPLDREQAEWCYLVARAIGARRIVEFGTSFGVSTIHWAAAVRDNGGGLVIGSELWPEKAEQARHNVEAAGLAAFVDIRTGDGRETLRDPGGPVDLVLLDGRPDYYVGILKMLEPFLRRGGVVITDNVFRFEREMAPYLDYVKRPEHGYRSVTLPLKDGTEFAVRV
jgi:predicted O-methyltransferase YrrM